MGRRVAPKTQRGGAVADSPNKIARLDEDQIELFNLSEDVAEHEGRFDKERAVADELYAPAQRRHERICGKKGGSEVTGPSF